MQISWEIQYTEGDIVISTKYDRTFSFSEGLGGFCNYEGEGEHSNLYSCGFLNKSGKEVIHLESYYRVGGDRGGDPWDTVHLAFSQGLAEVIVDDMFGYINKKGEFLIEPQFDYAAPFYNGLANVSIDSESVVINKKGEIEWSV